MEGIIKYWGCIVAVALGWSAVPSHAIQFTLPENEQPEIVVLGLPDVDQQIVDFVSEIGRETGTDQLARWHQPICPLTIGLADELNYYISDTILAVGEIVGAPIASGACRANVVVMVTDDPAAVIGRLENERVDIYRSISVSERDAILSGRLGVLGFSRIEIRGSDGRMPIESKQFNTANPTNGGSSQTYSASILTGVEAGRSQASTRADLNFRAIIIDLNHLEGQTIQQIAAFSTMMALAEFDIREPIVPPLTILNLFHDPAAAPADFTDWDIAYLRSLYVVDGGMTAHAQRSTMIRVLRDDLAQTVSEDE